MAGPREFYRKKYKQFMVAVSEHMDGCETGLDEDKRLVWIKLGSRKIWLDIWFERHYEKRYYGGEDFMMMIVKWIRVLRIGRKDLSFDFYAYDINIPFNDYIHEQSRLHQFLMLLDGMARGRGWSEVPAVS